MRGRRRNRGFERAGRLPPEQIDLPRARARELVLAAAWRRAAGEALARRATAVSVRRGVLEIEVHDERWRETLTSVLPALASRLARQCPELGVRKFSLRGGPGPKALASPDLSRLDLEPPRAERPAVEPRPAGATPEERLSGAMERYLESTRRSPRR